MSVYSGSRLESLYVQKQSAARTFTNSSGTWTNTGAQLCRHDKFTATPNNPINSPVFKTGDLSLLAGIRGRQSGTATYAGPLIPSGTAGTAPDLDAILQSVFGATATIVSSTSVTYNLGKTVYPIGFFRYNKSGGSSPTNTYALGCAPTQFKLSGNQSFLNIDTTFAAVGIGDSVNFASYSGSLDAVLAGALSTYPAEPSSPSVNGNVLSGFGNTAGIKFACSSLSLSSTAIPEFRGTVELTCDTGITQIADTMNDYYALDYARGIRKWMLGNITAVDSDSSNLNILKQAAFSKATMTVTMVFGSVAGSIVTVTVNNVQTDGMELVENGDTFDVRFPNAMAHGSSISSANDVVIAFT